MLPITNRYHLSAARHDLQKETAAVDFNSYTTLGANQMLYLNDENLLAQFKANKTNRPIIISEPSYDQATLWRIHDCYRSERAVSRSIYTLVSFTVGRKRTRIILDTNDYYDNEENENMDLDDIQNNDLYKKYVRGLSRINKNLNIHDAQKVLMTNALVFGHGALLIEWDKEPLDGPTAIPVALKPLSSLRIFCSEKQIHILTILLLTRLILLVSTIYIVEMSTFTQEGNVTPETPNAANTMVTLTKEEHTKLQQKVRNYDLLKQQLDNTLEAWQDVFLQMQVSIKTVRMQIKSL